MYTSTRQAPKDGFELQFGTNHLGHFALTGLLLDNMLPVDGSRVVTMSSVGHRILATIHFDDLQLEQQLRPRRRVRAVQARQPAVHLRAGASAEAKGAPTIALAAHPGASDTELLRNCPGCIRRPSQFVWRA